MRKTMKAIMRGVLPICAALLVLLSGCGGQDGNHGSDRPAASERSALQVPSSELYSLTGVDGVIFDAVSQYVNEGKPDSDVYIPALGLVGEYEDDSGNRCYVVKCHLYLYFDLENGVDGVSELSFGEEVSWFCAALAKDGSVANLLKSQDGDAWAESVRELCGPLADLAEGIIDNTDPAVIRAFSEADREELLQVYIEALD